MLQLLHRILCDTVKRNGLTAQMQDTGTSRRPIPEKDHAQLQRAVEIYVSAAKALEFALPSNLTIATDTELYSEHRVVAPLLFANVNR